MNKNNNGMMTFQTFQPCVSSVRTRKRITDLVSAPSIRLRKPAKRDVRALLHPAKITYMSKCFVGIGLSNDNGGLEFYNKRYKELRMSATISYIDDLRERAASFEHEIFMLRKTIEEMQEQAVQWRSAFSELKAHQKKLSDSNVALIEQGKTGMINIEDSAVLRRQYRYDYRRVTKDIETVKRKIDDFNKKKHRLSYLEGVLEEIYGKVELVEQELPSYNTFTIGDPGVLTVPYIKGVTNKNCCLFMNVFDFLAYDFLSNQDLAPALPRFYDAIILNDCRNIMTLLMNVDVYDHIYCFFPHTLAGKIINDAVKARKSDCVVDLSDCYDDYATLYDYVLTFEEFVPITDKI